MKRNALIILILLLICSDILAQSGSSIYHLKGATFQGTNFNPSFMPHEKFVLGLPIISGVNIGLNAPFTYDEVMKSDENALAEKFNGEDHFSAQADITLLYLGWKPIDRLGISLFARQRFQTRAYIDESLAQAAADGMKDLNSANIQSNDTKIDARYYREYGIGLATSSKDRKIDFGIRVKLIYGISNISSSDNMALSVEVNDLDKIENMIQNTEGQLNMDDLKQSVQISNAYVNTSGENTVQDFSSHINPTQNIGMGLDLGINWRLDQNVSVAFAVNDIGFINWKKDIKNYEVDNLNLNISSADDLMLSDGTIDATLIDSLQNVLEADTTHSAYKTGLNANAFGSISYDITSRDQATLTIASYFSENKVISNLYALGYTHKFKKVLSLSANLTHIQDEGVDLGIGILLDFAHFQFYMSTDEIAQFSTIQNPDAFDAKIGMVFLFGRENIRIATKQSIYRKIKKRKQPHPYKYARRS